MESIRPGRDNCSGQDIETLDISVLLRLDRLDVLDPDLLRICPTQHRPTYVFGPIVAANGRGLAAPLDDPLQGANDPRRRQRQVGVDYEPVAVEFIQDIENR